MKKISVWKKVGKWLSIIALSAITVGIVTRVIGVRWEVSFVLSYIIGAPCLIGGISLQFAYYVEKSKHTEKEVIEFEKRSKRD